MTRLRLGILISGAGTNMDAIIRACAAPDYPAAPAIVISNRPKADGLEKAKARGVPSLAVDHKRFSDDREAFEREIDAALIDAGVEIIALAGFMRVLTPWFVERWAGRLVNVHPSLLPKYPGLHTHKRAIEAGDAEHGCTVHWVTVGVDEGAPIDQARVPIEANDTPETLAARVQRAEHELYPRALAKACETLKARA